MKGVGSVGGERSPASFVVGVARRSRAAVEYAVASDPVL